MLRGTKVEILRYPSEVDWMFAKASAFQTVGKRVINPPTSGWKTEILASEHSPVRTLMYSWRWINLPYWVSVHFTRHKIGIEHFVSSQRNDKQDEYDRNEARQDAPVTHMCTANAQAILNISHVRLCLNASLETITAWRMLLSELTPFSPELVSLCAPTCIYRNGICPEFKCCGYNTSLSFEGKRKAYFSMVNRLKERKEKDENKN